VVRLTAAAGTRGRTRLAVLGLLLALAAVAWATTAVRMDGMESAPGMYPEDLGFYESAWIVMMAASLLQTVYMPLSFLAIPELS